MKKIILILFCSLFVATAFAQTNQTEVLYFKASLGCCKAAACNNMENEIKAIIQKNYPKGEVAFKQVVLADENNKKLVEKYNAKSQTVVAVRNYKKKETSVDLSDIVGKYARTGDKAQLEKDLVAKINTILK